MSQKHTLREFTHKEGKNLQLGQAGYEIMTTTGGSPITSSEGEWTAYMVLDGLVNVVPQDHVPSGDSSTPIGPGTVGVIHYGYWSSIVGSRASGTDPWTIILYKG